MPKFTRYKTKYPGIYYIKVKSNITGKQEKIFYITYRSKGRLVEEKAGRQYQNDMTAARASILRAAKITGKVPTNKEKRKATDKNALYILNRLWQEYKSTKSGMKCIVQDVSGYNKYIKYELGNKEPADIKPQDIDRLRNRLLRTLKPQTVKHFLVLIRRIINFDVSRQLCPGLTFKIEMPKFNNQKPEDFLLIN